MLCCTALEYDAFAENSGQSIDHSLTEGCVTSARFSSRIALALGALGATCIGAICIGATGVLASIRLEAKSSAAKQCMMLVQWMLMKYRRSKPTQSPLPASLYIAASCSSRVEPTVTARGKRAAVSATRYPGRVAPAPSYAVHRAQ